ncbi:MAG: nuclear transport factor 2 family protein [Pseudomonadota bacterium]
MVDTPSSNDLLQAVAAYFDLMYDFDTSRFERVFAASAQLHGLRDGGLKCITANEFKSALAANPSPQSKDAVRHQEILLVDFASPTQALVKVRVRIDTLQYIDYLSYHVVDGAWIVTAKSFHIECTFDTPQSHVANVPQPQ